MNKSLIIPLSGFVTAVAVDKYKSIDEQLIDASGDNNGFVVVSNTAGRNDGSMNKKCVRLFEVVNVPDGSDDTTKSFIGRRFYFVCFENEQTNNIIVDKSSGKKIFILPTFDMLAEQL